MPTYKDQFIVEACKNLSRHPLIRKSLRSEFGEATDTLLGHLRRGEQLPKRFAGAYDNIIQVLTNHAPVVKESAVKECGETYLLQIIGLPGGYYVHAGEYGKSEIFPSFKAAKAHAETYGEFG
jgi:hypothetical protein